MCSGQIPSSTERFSAGTNIINEGEVDRKLYVLLDGKCTVFKRDVEISSFDGRGTLFGEICMILDTPRTATVKAATDVAVAVIEIDLDVLLMNYPEITKMILQILAKRVTVETERIFSNLATLDLGELGLE